MTVKLRLLLLLVIGLTTLGCQQETKSEEKENSFNVDFESYELENGLKVILHIDRSDPVVAVALTAHVGSAREIEGRTGFAHLFEHLLFLESENLGKGGLDKMSARIGGSGANGSTSRDRTNYFQTVPKDALEKMIWAEADKLGYFINTVSEPVLAKEKQVVKNEKRQSVDNRPYGHTQAVISEELYPQGHPYSWTVIGSLEDLQNATLQDVKDFYNRWYVPNNVTLTIAGDLDIEQTKVWVKKYFEEIPRGQDIPTMEKQPVTLDISKKLFYEDNFARLPQLTMVWPGVYQYHPDSYPLSVLSEYLSQGKKAPLNKVLVDEDKLTDRVRMGQYNSEVAGQLSITVTGYDQVALDSVAAGINKAFEQFEENGISQADLDRIKAGQETAFYNSLSSVLGKGFQLAQYQIFADDPAYVNEDVQRILSVTPEDVMRVYNTYIKDKNFIATSFVPKGQTNLILAGSTEAIIKEEKIIDGVEETFDASIAAEYDRSPSSFDRTVEPPYGESPSLKVPEVWQDQLNSGIKVFGIQNDEVPLVQFEMEIQGGQMFETPETLGSSNLMANLMTRGTKTKSPEELEAAIESLGASIFMYATQTGVVISGNTLSRNYPATMELVSEILLEPRWDAEEFELLKTSTVNSLKAQLASPNSIASNEFAKLIYAEDEILANNRQGTTESVSNLTIEDLQNYYNTNLSAKLSSYYVVGDISKEAVLKGLVTIDANWQTPDLTLPEVTMADMPESAAVYFYDVPNAKQSVLSFGYPALKAKDEDYYLAGVMNYRLGGGGFASQLTQQLREGKGYTYGIRSRFSGDEFAGRFSISSGVRTNVTYEATALVKDILENYGKNFNSNDLDVTKSFNIKSNARAFETLGAKLNMLSNMSHYDLPADYALQREQQVKDLTVDQVKELAKTYLKPNQMIYLVVGDAATQVDKLEQLGLPIIMLNPEPLKQ
ncbi:M16 family metallopeptidase [Winogradskyella aurantiaca]|uniref:M16 family metallopeptidase n=1 Tax=Winogradskyella aurantiaca TaxID=2219558 RepID=UPI000E1E0CAE|nr:pitrilysin family protein [Winogradskyella aurantiaca]